MQIITFTFLSLIILPWAWLWLIPTIVIPVPTLFCKGIGLALPGIILLTPRATTERILRHEIVHQQQMRRYSPLGLYLLTGIIYVVLYIRHYKQYTKWPNFWQVWSQNYLEVEANKLMDLEWPLPKLIGWPIKRSR